MDLTAVLTPLGSLWLVHQALAAAAKFANGLRDQVILGYVDGREITPEHRQLLALDWKLTMTGTIGAAIMFGSAIWFTASALDDDSQTGGISVSVALRVVAGFVFLSALLFVRCGISDYSVMKTMLVRNSTVA